MVRVSLDERALALLVVLSRRDEGLVRVRVRRRVRGRGMAITPAPTPTP